MFLFIYLKHKKSCVMSDSEDSGIDLNPVYLNLSQTTANPCQITAFSGKRSKSAKDYFSQSGIQNLCIMCNGVNQGIKITDQTKRQNQT